MDYDKGSAEDDIHRLFLKMRGRYDLRFASDEKKHSYRVERDLNYIERTRHLPTNRYVVTRYSYDYNWIGLDFDDADVSLLEHGFAIKCLDLVELKWECYLPDPEYDDCSIHLIITEDEVNKLVRKSKDLPSFLSSYAITMMEFASSEMMEKLLYICDYFNIVDFFDLSGDDAEAIPVDSIKLVDKSTITPSNIKTFKMSNLSVFDLYVKSMRLKKIALGAVKTIRRTLTDEIAFDLLAWDGDYKIKRQFQNIDKDWDINDMNNGLFPFIPVHFEAVKFISSETKGWVIAALEGMNFSPNNDNSAWIVEFRIGEILKEERNQS